VRDRSNGYEAIAAEYARVRTPDIGPRIVRSWAKGLPAGASILDIGCGHGIPISEALIQDGFAVYGVDAAPALVAKFRERFPDAAVECRPVEDSLFFSRSFDAVVAWGLFFLLTVEAQRRLIGKVAQALDRHGRFLFTSPKQACTWMDAMTGLPSVSLGAAGYAEELALHGLALTGDAEDEGENYYYFATKL
jgi:2-polyprenyl-3-methyl-5-hydroxy-6-metoxy-1,4-benzoquinol methylase